MAPVAKPKPVLRRHFLGAWRKFRGISQDAAAQVIGLSRSQLSRIETIQSPYSQWVMEAAAKLYDCTVDDLLNRDPFAPGPPIHPIDPLVDDLKNRPQAVQDTAVAVLDSILKTVH